MPTILIACKHSPRQLICEAEHVSNN